jgi:hypothetical protein
VRSRSSALSLTGESDFSWGVARTAPEAASLKDVACIVKEISRACRPGDHADFARPPPHNVLDSAFGGCLSSRRLIGCPHQAPAATLAGQMEVACDERPLVQVLVVGSAPHNRRRGSARWRNLGNRRQANSAAPRSHYADLRIAALLSAERPALSLMRTLAHSL